MLVPLNTTNERTVQEAFEDWENEGCQPWILSSVVDIPNRATPNLGSSAARSTR